MAPWRRYNGLQGTRRMAPQAAASKLLVAGFAQWVNFVCDRWQEKSVC